MKGEGIRIKDEGEAKVGCNSDGIHLNMSRLTYSSHKCTLQLHIYLTGQFTYRHAHTHTSTLHTHTSGSYSHSHTHPDSCRNIIFANLTFFISKLPHKVGTYWRDEGCGTTGRVHSHHCLLKYHISISEYLNY